MPHWTSPSKSFEGIAKFIEGTNVILPEFDQKLSEDHHFYVDFPIFVIPTALTFQIELK